MKDLIKTLLLWFVIIGILFFVFNYFGPKKPEPHKLPYSQFIHHVEQGNIVSVTIADHQITGLTQDHKPFSTYLPIRDPALLPQLIKKGVDVKGEPAPQPGFWSQVGMQALSSILFILVLVLVWSFIFRQQMGGGSRNPFSFGRSRARLLSEGQVKVTFADVAGCDEAKEDVKELVDFLKDPEKFQKLGGRIPRGVLLMGAPGTGKTLLAKAVAGEAKVPFFSISGSDFVEMFVGVGASRVRDMFEQAKKQSPCIIFIDEIDAVGRKRGGGFVGGHDEREQTLNQLLVEMDGFEGKEGVIVLAATNRPDVLDPALLRPGRFDRQIVVPLPDVRGREAILNVHIRKVPLEKNVEISLIARGTPGFSGADLANLVNEAALIAARNNQKQVGMGELEQAKDKILMGAERRSMVMTEEEKRNTAYHEAGHAIVGRSVPEHDPIHKVTIIPRGRALGVTMFLPERDRYSVTKQHLESQISSLFGGRIAEGLIFGSHMITTGAANDIKKATEIAWNMVTKWGLSELGPLFYSEDESEMFLPQPFTMQRKEMSDHTAKLIDEEVKSIINRNYQRAENILKDKIHILHLMAEALMKYETLDSEQIDDIMSGKLPLPPKGWDQVEQSKAENNASQLELTPPQTASSSLISKRPRFRRSSKKKEET
ncbi:MAG: ATP-dependent zinc metalloprotease FtsH [Gammaproteobacteria bacterium]|nr:ATP-dependent zinc metalloprotease FtsH [Gammaproteobacteria bacterium]